MEPDVVRMYSSSPPPLNEDGEEEDEDDFGEFGGYCCGVSSSFSFSEYDAPTAFDQSIETHVSRPDLYSTSTRSVSLPEKELAFEETEKITKDHEVLESLVGETDVALDQKNDKLEVLKVLHNGPLLPDSQEELAVVSITGKERTSEGQDSKPGIKDEHSDGPKTDQVGHCLTNGPTTICTHEEPERPTVTSARSTECVLASRAEDSSTETDRASNPEGIDSCQLLEDDITLKGVSEVMDALAGHRVTKSQEGVSSLDGEEQSNKKKMEKEAIADDDVSRVCLPSGASSYEMQVVCGSEDIRDAAESSLVPVMEIIATSGEQVEDREETPVNPVDKGSHLVPGREELEEGLEEERLPVGDPTAEAVQDVEADLVIREVKRIAGGSSTESDEDFGDFRDATQGFPDVSQTESVSQEGFADFVTALSDCSSTDEFTDMDTLKDLKEEEEMAEKDKNDEDDDDDDDDSKNQVMTCSELPPSDSFADFSSAPFGGLANTPGESWAEFGQHEACEMQQESWAAFDEEQKNSTATAPSSESLQTDMSFGLSQKLQHLFESTFPSEMAAEDTDVPTLQTLLEPRDSAEIRESVGMWRRLLDIHSAHGLKVQWVGSHSNRILLDCLGIYNILFTDQSKKPVIVPMFAAGLGMLEPTKEPVKPSSILPASSPGQGRLALCSQQVVSSLRFEDDGSAATHLNLDFFGPVEDCSSDSDTDTPIPGVDPELYELTTVKLEGGNRPDTFARLMEMVEKTSTVTRKPEQDGEISQEAAHVISLLPDLSFMHARVLMFPSTLTPASSHP